MMSDVLKANAEYAEKMKSTLKLRYEPVAVKLIREGEDYPDGLTAPLLQLSHCQAVFRAKEGECLKVPLAMNSCHVGAAILGMMATPEKVGTGEFHYSTGIHDSLAATKEMIELRKLVPYKTVGEAVCPLGKAEFVPDAVVLIDIPERIYWISAMSTAEKGNRSVFSTAPFQCACEDVVALPIVEGMPNVSLGCFGCRKKTDMQADELACGIPFKLIPEYAARLERYSSGVLAKAKRD